MIIYGWGRDMKKVAYAGIEKCTRCGNYGHFWIGESAAYVSLYFVKLAKYKKKLYLCCDSCQGGIEIDPAQKDAILRATIALPTVEQANAMWKHLDNALANRLSNLGPAEAPDWATRFLDVGRHELRRSFDPAHVDYIMVRFARYFVDLSEAKAKRI